jgi:hypothetical protein
VSWSSGFWKCGAEPHITVLSSLMDDEARSPRRLRVRELAQLVVDTFETGNGLPAQLVMVPILTP